MVSTCQPSHLCDQALERDLSTVVNQERGATAKVLAYIAEFDARRLYLPAGYPSMYLYCLHRLQLCEQAAYKRIHAARAARRFPYIFHAVADGRLHLSAVVLLAPHLTGQNADELLAAAAQKTKSEIEQLLAQRFPRPDLPTRLETISPSSLPAPAAEQLSPGKVDQDVSELVAAVPIANVQDPQLAASPRHVVASGPRWRITPLSPQRVGLQVTLAQETVAKLEQVRALLSHQIPSGEVSEVLDRVLDIAIQQLEKRKYAATEKPRPSQQGSPTDTRYIPAHVKRAVRERDGDRCTFVSKTGHQCEERRFLEFDHVQEFVRGGTATLSGIRLRCRAHNQYTAECTFGTEFMNHKRAAAAEARADSGAG